MNLAKLNNARHRVTTLMMAVLGTALSIMGWFLISNLEDRISAAEFNSKASIMAAALQNGVNEGLTKVFTLRALFESSQDSVSEEEFLSFSKRLLRYQPGPLSLSWVPRIPDNERAAHEQIAQMEGAEGYRIRSVSKDGTPRPSPTAPEYFPVFYTTEEVRADFVRGLNLADNGTRQHPLERARDGDMLAASEEFTLQSGTGDRLGFFVVLPIYKRGLPHNSVEERRRNLLGFVQGVFQIDSMLVAKLRGIRIPVDFFIFSNGAGSDARQIYSSPASALNVVAMNGRVELDNAFHWASKIAVADRQWSMIAMPGKVSPITHLSAWIFLTAGLCLTVVVFAFMWRANRQNCRLLEANETISELACTDSLTGLANRRSFHDRLTAAFEDGRRGGEPFALFSIDLDHFKDFNDLMGHPAGDELLVQVGQRLRAEANDSDCVARLGGDEFAILKLNAGSDGTSEAFAEKIIAALNGLPVLEGHASKISASVGISRYVEDLDGPDTIVMQADLALYRAKDAGRNRACFHDKAFDQLASERVILGRELMAAIEGGGLELHYQPQVDIESGRIIGLEGLVRWNHPQRGSISPAVFIPLAEKTGSIVDLGKWVFDEACRQTRIWQDQGIELPSVAVNVSAIQCKRTDFEQDIVSSLKRWRIAPNRIELELTESVLIEATQHHCDMIARLRALGLRIAIDDFGTGYSSLNYLTNFPVDRIKIAQELVFKCTTEIRHAAVVRAAIHLAQELNTESLAEGIETPEQVRFLSAAGCKVAQGYLFSRPVEAAQATRLLCDGVIRPNAIPATAKNSGSRLAKKTRRAS